VLGIFMQDCLFCKIIRGEIPGKFIYRDDQVVAFHDISPKAPIHFLIVPVKHIESLREIKKEHQELLGELMLTVNTVAEKLGIDKNGYKVVINNGRDAGQLVFHLHLHVLGGWRTPANWKV
jgi:histidine triad (HIT) family protein